MAIGTFRLKRQTAGSGAFGVVVLDVDFADKPSAVAVAPDAQLSEGEYYVPAVRVGVNYAWDELLRRDMNSERNTHESRFLRVRILQITSTTADTTDMLIVYCTILAVFDALQMPAPALPKIEVEGASRRVSFAF